MSSARSSDFLAYSLRLLACPLSLSHLLSYDASRPRPYPVGDLVLFPTLSRPQLISSCLLFFRYEQSTQLLFDVSTAHWLCLSPPANFPPPCIIRACSALLTCDDSNPSRLFPCIGPALLLFHSSSSPGHGFTLHDITFAQLRLRRASIGAHRETPRPSRSRPRSRGGLRWARVPRR